MISLLTIQHRSSSQHHLNYRGRGSSSGASAESWPSNADTHKMSPEEIKGTKPSPGHNPGEVLHQRRKLPFSPTAMAAAGLLIVGAIGYFTLYAKSKRGTKPGEVAKVVAGASDGDGSPQQQTKK